MAKRKAHFEVYQAADGYRWRLRSANNMVIAESDQPYAEKRKCLRGIEAVKREARGARVEDLAAD